MSNLRAEIIPSAAEARSQAAISERFVKLQQELADLQIQSQLDKAELVGCYRDGRPSSSLQSS